MVAVIIRLVANAEYRFSTDVSSSQLLVVVGSRSSRWSGADAGRV